MADQDLEIKFGVNAGGVAPGVQATKDQIEQLTAAVRQQTFVMAQGFNQMADAAVASSNRAKNAAHETESAFRQISEGVMMARDAVERFLAVLAVERGIEFARGMGEAGEKVEHMSQRLGVAVPDVQRLGAMAALTGSDLSQVGMAAQRMDRSFAAAKKGTGDQATAFKTLGINVKENVDNMTLLREVAVGLANMADGPTKAATAMAVLGRSGAELIPLMNNLGLNWDQMNQLITKYGVANEEANAKAAELGEVFNEQKVAGLGVQNMLADALAPTLTVAVRGFNDLVASMIQSYNHGGMMKTVMDGVAMTLKIVIAFVSMLGAGFVESFETMRYMVDQAVAQWNIFVARVKEWVTVLIDEFRGLGTVIFDALTGRLGAIVSDVDAAMAKISADVRKASAEIAGLQAQAAALAGKDAGALAGTVNGENAFLGHVFNGGGGGPSFRQSKTGGDTSGDPGAKDKKGKKAQSRVAEWESQLQDQLADQKKFFGDSVEAELAYWQKILTTDNVSAQERREITRKMYALEKEQAHASRDEVISELKAKTDAAVDLAKGEADARMNLLKAADEAAKAQAQAGEITLAQEYARRRAILDQEVEAEQQASNKIYLIKLAELHMLEAIYNDDPKMLAKTEAEEERLAAQHEKEITGIVSKGNLDRQKLNDQALKDYAAAWKHVLDPIASSFANMIHGMITRTTSLRQAMLKIGDSILGDAISWIVKMGEKWVITHVLMNNSSQAFQAIEKMLGLEGMIQAKGQAATEVTNNAAVAGAGVFAQVSMTPAWPTAPAAAMAASAEVMGFMSGLSAYGGLGEVPYDGFQVTAHKKESVLPAWFSEPLRRSVATGQIGGDKPLGGSGSGSGGDTYNISALDSRDVRNFFRRNIGEVQKFGRRAVQGGSLAALSWR